MDFGGLNLDQYTYVINLLMFVKGYQAVVICESWHFTHMLKSLA